MGEDFFLTHHTHCRPTTARTMRQAATDAGFAVVEVRFFCQWPRPRLSKLIPDWHKRLTIARLS
jgi:hypothetical protein